MTLFEFTAESTDGNLFNLVTPIDDLAGGLTETQYSRVIKHVRKYWYRPAAELKAKAAKQRDAAVCAGLVTAVALFWLFPYATQPDEMTAEEFVLVQCAILLTSMILVCAAAYLAWEFVGALHDRAHMQNIGRQYKITQFFENVIAYTKRDDRLSVIFRVPGQTASPCDLTNPLFVCREV